MEKRKLLLIVISVGVFLVIVIGATMLVFAPKTPKPIAAQTPVAAPTGTATTGPATVDASEWVRDPSAVSSLQNSSTPGTNGRGDVIVIYGDRPNQVGTTATAPAQGDKGSVIDVPAPAGVTVPEPSAKPEAGAQAVAVAPKPAATPKPVAVKTATAKTEAPKKVLKAVDDFWVQTGSFSAKNRADAAKETLAAKGIASLVETKEVGGKTFYRVRVGPYASKSEAEYWLSLVKTVDGFSESFVSLTKAKR
jgi:DedD protein